MSFIRYPMDHVMNQPASAVTEITADTFETEVLAASMQIPVVIDFWAPWCGPCQSMAPILDKLAEELAGRVKIVKINTDEEMQIASLFGIKSLPTVVLLKDGQPVDGFMGAQPAGVIRQWLEPHLGPAVDAPPSPIIGAPPAVNEAPAAAPKPAGPPPQEALAHARQQLAAEPDKVEHKHALIAALIAAGELDEAQSRLGDLTVAEGESDPARRARATLDFHGAVGKAPSIAELDARLQTNPDDHEARHLLGIRLLLDGDHAAALETFLELMRRDRGFGDDLGRKSLVQAFALVDDTALVGRTRRQMSSLLF